MREQKSKPAKKAAEANADGVDAHATGKSAHTDPDHDEDAEDPHAPQEQKLEGAHKPGGGRLGGDHAPAPAAPAAPAATGASTPAGPAAPAVTPTITSKTKFSAVGGGGDTRHVVGVGEPIDFTGSAKGTWSATGGSPGTSSGESDTFSWTAPGTAGQFRIKLKVGDKEAVKEIAVIAPTTMSFKRASTIDPPAGVMGAGMMLDMTVGPSNVSFGAITIKEVAGGASGLKGYFGRLKIDLSHKPASNGTFVNNNNTLTVQDQAKIVDTDPKEPWPKPLAVGSMTWQIPHTYSVGDVADKNFTIVAQTMSIVDSKGTVTITKGNASYTRSPGPQTKK